MTEHTYSIYSYIHQARQVYRQGGNISEFLRKSLNEPANTPEIIEVSYDLQSGSYIKHIRQFQKEHHAYCKEIANYIDKHIDRNSSLLEVGCGEMTTLLGVYTHFSDKLTHILGFDISLSRVKVGLDYWNSQNVQATKTTFFVADLFHIPLADNSIDIVLTSHAIEPNGGKEVEALRSIFRVARKRVLLFEPYFEKASIEGQARMLKHGYIRDHKC
jgi:ubiquinone/menaquinone biosynthesis C-methylase UbiE